MRDQHELAMQCLEVEEQGKSVLDFLKNQGFISPKATWQRLQLNELGRKPHQLKDGKDGTPMKKLTLEMKKKAVQIKKDGGDYLGYLKSVGMKNPSASWNYILVTLRKSNPEAYAEITGKKKEENPAEDPPVVKLTGPVVIETPEPEKVEVKEAPVQISAVATGKYEISNPLMYEQFTVREVEGLFGRYRRSDVGATYIDFENADGGVDVMSYTLKQWASFIKELKRAAQVLGVNIDE